MTITMAALLGLFAEYCYTNNLPFKVTSITEDVRGRVTTTHREGRAVDLSTKGWTVNDIETATQYFNSRYSPLCAISKSDLKPRCLVYHNHRDSLFLGKAETSGICAYFALPRNLDPVCHSAGHRRNREAGSIGGV